MAARESVAMTRYSVSLPITTGHHNTRHKSFSDIATGQVQAVRLTKTA